jgi:hypothetical protein
VLALVLALLAGAPSVVSPLAVLPGGRGAPFEVRVEVLPLEPGRALAWRSDGEALVATGGDHRHTVSLRIAPAEDGALSLEVAIAYEATVAVEREAVSLVLPGPARVLGRDLSFEKLARAVRVDRGTPILLATPALALAGGPGLAAARYVPRGRDVVVELVLDDAASHPFAVYEKCLQALPGLSRPGPVPFAELERKRSLAQRTRRQGETVTARAVLYPLGGGELLPLIPERWADGARAAVVFTDHADRTDPAALRALLYGDSRLLCRPGGPAGLIGHGIKITKSFFLRARRGGLEELETRELAEEILAAGSEVASHSISGDPDDRESVRAALPELATLGVVTWIDHEPYTNCEAFSSEGWRAEGRYGIRDLLADAGFRWIWEAGDVGGFAPEPQIVNVLGAPEPDRPRPPVYPLPMDDRLWVFQTSMFYGPPEKLAAALEEGPLLRLEAERGLFVAHTYLSASARTTSRPEHLARLVVRELPGGGLELNPAFDAALARLAAHVRAGVLSTLTWAEAGDRLRALGEVEVRYRPDGSAEVANRGAADLLGLTLAVPAGDIDVAVDGARVKGMSTEAGRTRVWLDLPAGGRVRVRASRGDAAAPFLPPAGDALGAR